MAEVYRVLNTSIAVVYPVLQTGKVVVQGGEVGRWMLYWIIFSAVSILDILLHSLLQQINIIVSAFLLRNTFLLWCMVPSQYSGVSLLVTQVSTIGLPPG